jgi:type IV secretory pathway VirB4 component
MIEVKNLKKTYNVKGNITKALDDVSIQFPETGMVFLLGKSGSGKSYATKTILTQLCAENCKIFILDPENEYQVLAQNLGGRLIDVGTASEGRINPFHVITTLEGDELGSDSKVNNFAVHLQFLEEFFRVALDGISSDALEYLNNIIVDLYKRKNIDSKTDFSRLGPKDFPTFDELFNLIDEKLNKATVDYDVTQLRILHNYVSKFAGDGRNANLWNGESTLSVKENFTVFNFQSLLANKNGVIANAQMLLVLKWLDNEIIKNRDFNIKHNTNRKIVVAIDEAHVFIDPKYPVALDFMYQLAKRIRKYNGMQIVITQNIKDFVGSEEIIRKSTAIINACQYSFIFSLSPNDMDDLCTLYDKAGQINEVEQDQIVNNPRGNAFIITSPTSRTNISIIAFSSAISEVNAR